MFLGHKGQLGEIHPLPAPFGNGSTAAWGAASESFPILWYLGVEIHRDLKQFIALNLNPVTSQLAQRCATWKSLPLTLVGRVNLVKMSVLPKFTYLFRQMPVPIPNLFFKRLGSIIT